MACIDVRGNATHFWSLIGGLAVITVVALLVATRVLARRWRRNVE